MSEKYFCLICYNQYDEDWENCPSCDSEGMGMSLYPLSEVLEKTKLEKLEEVRDNWSKIEGFREKYKIYKLKKMNELIELKKEYDIKNDKIQ